jgi:cell volume regulation protein A
VTDGQLILVAGSLLGAGVVASLLATRLRVPGLVLFLGLGMAVGSDGTGWIDFGDYQMARTIGIIALALILFEGGLTSGVIEIRPVLGPAAGLALVGTLVTAFIAGLAAAWLFDFSLLEGLLLGAVLSSTDGAAIFALLRNSTLRRRLARTLEAESGFNDPVAVLLVIGFIDWLQQPDYGLGDMVVLLIRQLGIGVAVGLAVGWLAVRGFQRAQLTTAGLYPVASLATAAVAFGAADVLHGSGFLAVYLAGLALGSANVPAKQTTANFHQGLSWVAQIAMFLTLGLLVFPSQLGDVALEGTVLALVVVFVARPVATALATLPFGFSWPERAVLGWAGLRGAVPVVLATFAVIDGVPHSVEFFNIVFFAVLLSTLLQGATFEPLAHRLGLTTSQPALPRPLAEAGTIRRLGAEVLEYPVAPDDAIAGARVRDLDLPRDAVVNVIVRGAEAVPPRGSTRLRAHDIVHVLVRTRAAGDLRALTERWRTGPIGPPLRPPKPMHGRGPVFTAWRWTAGDGDAGKPVAVRGAPVIAQLRVRRDEPGGLWVLDDGRYAVSGPVGAVGGRGDLSEWALRRMRKVHSDERAWLQTVVGALAADRHETRLGGRGNRGE